MHVIIPWGQVLTWMTNLYTIISYYYLTTSPVLNNTLAYYHYDLTMINLVDVPILSDDKSWREWLTSTLPRDIITWRLVLI